MKKTKTDFRHESIQDSDSIKDILKAITDGIGKNEITFSDEDDSIAMSPKGLLNLKISASQDDNDNQISIRINWQTKPNKKKLQSNLSVK